MTEIIGLDTMLGKVLAEKIPPNLKVVIYCAWDMSDLFDVSKQEKSATKAINSFNEYRSSGFKFVFISTRSQRNTPYVSAKLRVEEYIGSDGIIIRLPALVTKNSISRFIVSGESVGEKCWATLDDTAEFILQIVSSKWCKETNSPGTIIPNKLMQEFVQGVLDGSA